MFEKIKAFLVESLNYDPDDITENSDFKEDLGLDSLDLFEMVNAIEEECGFEFPLEDLENMHTIRDVVDYLRENGIE